MTVFGKVLIFLNLLAAGAFTYLTLQDWKLRQELQWARFRGEVLLEGFPVEAAEKAPSGVDSDRVAFNRKAPGVVYETLPRTRLADICPRGDERFGGEPVPTQTEEIARLGKKVVDGLPGMEVNQGRDRFLQLQTYLVNLARTGAERDGVKALFDLFDSNRRDKARRDLAFLAKTSSQTEALRTMVDVLDLGDPQAIADEKSRNDRIKVARDAVARFALGEAAHGGGDTAEAERLMKNLLANPNSDKQAVKAAAPAAGFDNVIEVAANPLTTKQKVDEAVASLSAYAAAKAVPAHEKAALAAVDVLIKHPIGPNNLPPKAANVDAAAVAVLKEKFDDAAAPVGAGGPDASYAGKARKIAHILYHIDAHRHLSAQPADIADRQAWHQRVAWIVGLPMYVQVAEAQASEYAEAAQRLVSLITDEETAFRGEYNAAIDRARVLHSRWETLNTELNEQKAITDENVRLKNERLTERDKLRVELKESEDKAKDALDKLKTTQDNLFRQEKALRDAQEAILVLEKELRRRELGVE